MIKKILHIVAKSKNDPNKTVDLYYPSVKQAKKLNSGLFDFRAIGYWRKSTQ